MLVGVLATAVVALAVVVVVLVTDANDETTEGTTRAQTTSDVADPPCQLESMGGEVEIEFSSGAVGCAEARGIYSEFREMVRAGEAAGMEEASAVSGWSCEEFPFAKYPLIVRCRKGAEDFAVVGLAPHAHDDQGPPPGSDLTFFQTPSGNISCAMDASGVRCDIKDRSWSPPPQPGDCMLDWGNAVELHSQGSTFLCAGDTTANPANPVLGYGEGTAVGGFVCESEKQKLVCVNMKSKHGFMLSIQEVNLF